MKQRQAKQRQSRQERQEQDQSKLKWEVNSSGERLKREGNDPVKGEHFSSGEKITAGFVRGLPMQGQGGAELAALCPAGMEQLCVAWQGAGTPWSCTWHRCAHALAAECRAGFAPTHELAVRMLRVQLSTQSTSPDPGSLPGHSHVLALLVTPGASRSSTQTQGRQGNFSLGQTTEICFPIFTCTHTAHLPFHILRQKIECKP